MEGIAKLKFQLVSNPIVGANIYVARPDIYSTISEEAIIEYASKAAGITQSDMVVTLEALLDAFSYFVCNGHSFKIDGVGTFSLKMRTSAANLYEADPKTGADAVVGLGVNFLPAKELKEMIANLSIDTEAINPNNLAEFADAKATSVSFGKSSANLLTTDPNQALYCNPNNIVVLKGYNLSNGLRMHVEGVNGSDPVSADVTFSGVTRACNEVSGRIMTTMTKITSISLYEGESLVGSWTFTGEGQATAPVAYYGNQVITNGGNITFGMGPLSVRGNVEGAIVKLDGSVITPSSSSSSRIDFAEVLTVGQHTIEINGVVYAFKVFANATYNVTALSANGVTVQNGETSPVRTGQTYRFVATGDNVNLIQQSDIRVPSGATISNFSANANQVTFDVTIGSVGGEIVVGNFSCTVTISSSENAPTITSGAISDGGVTYFSVGGNNNLTFTGNNLSGVVVYFDGSLFNSSKWSASDNQLSINANVAGTYTIYTNSSANETIIRFSAEMNL